MKRIQQFPPCRRRLDIIHKVNVALSSKIILIVSCQYSCLSTLPLRWEVSRGALSYVGKPVASSLFLEGTKLASRDSRLHQGSWRVCSQATTRNDYFFRVTRSAVSRVPNRFFGIRDPGFFLFESRDPGCSLFVAGIRNYGAEMCTGC